MPSIASLAPFPDDLPTHSLLVVDYALVRANDKSELDKLWNAATQLGFWYLKNHNLHDEVDRMFDVCADTLDLPLEEKMPFEQGDDGDSFGYKARGTIATDKFGSSDNVEFLNIAQDDALSWPRITHRTYPPLVNDHMEDTFIPFVRKSMAINFTFLEFFEKRLRLPPGELVRRHAVDHVNGGEARCIKTPPKQSTVALGAHTDFGSLAIVHNRLGGLQVMPPDSEEWLYIKPIRGYAVCNIGDTLSIFSAGILRSNVHRVMPPPGEQSHFTRYSITFFTRPGYDVVLHALGEHSALIADAVAQAPEGQYETGSTARDWVARRIRNLRLKNRKGVQSWVASMGTEHRGVR
ncbi:hypothetical protein PHLGIDRAFT_99067 [Phlebiopsis gigantea 11061_1 CR5-6]|uniref:Fe2OG dioxygenase domain-containing protein n=1 Tax=Phlebiopsis gigantea (strain 11061_1 CR5-6) TaxID=745531 RepID=A0A0C3SF89_PHLG1|nr:hypothetical protein PHLGIDRAFT_99067 [Phlebiopsis gigantea 11061_1 CR5-6]